MFGSQKKKTVQKVCTKFAYKHNCLQVTKDHSMVLLLNQNSCIHIKGVLKILDSNLNMFYLHTYHSWTI